ncbi:MAG: translation initiation factor, partial [Weeksellaceae bacterium]|nr:translation initiation factor [Weeksellaceae bacterium]
MDLQEQLKKLFPDHVSSEEETEQEEASELWIQDEPIICKYEKRKGKPQTILEGYTGADEDFKQLAKEIKKYLSVGGSFKDDT